MDFRVHQNMMYIHHFAVAMEYLFLTVIMDIYHVASALTIKAIFRTDYVVQVVNALPNCTEARLLYDLFLGEVNVRPD